MNKMDEPRKERTVVVAYDSRQTCGQFQYAEPCAQMKSEIFFSSFSPGNYLAVSETFPQPSI